MKPKILFILHLPPPVHGAAMMGKYLQESILLNETFESDYINLTTSFNIKKIGKTSFAKFFTILHIQALLLKALLRKKYDLCYVTLTAKGAGFYKDLLIVTILKIFGKKIIYHFHNKGISENQHHWLNDKLYRFAFKGTQTILLSDLLYYDIAKYVKAEDIFYTPNGVPNTNFSQLETKEVYGNAICRLLFLSNMIIEKGVYILLEACKLLKEKSILFECHFIGSWGDISENDFRDKVENFQLSQFVFIHGEKYGEDKYIYLNNADIFVFPTFYHNEVFPLVNLEAMQFALPIVSTSIGGIPDAVKDGETGFLVPPKDPNLLAEKLELLIQNPKLRCTMGMAGNRRYRELFTIENFEKKIKRILQQAIVA